MYYDPPGVTAEEKFLIERRIREADEEIFNSEILLHRTCYLYMCFGIRLKAFMKPSMLKHGNAFFTIILIFKIHTI